MGEVDSSLPFLLVKKSEVCSVRRRSGGRRETGRFGTEELDLKRRVINLRCRPASYFPNLNGRRIIFSRVYRVSRELGDKIGPIRATVAVY